VDGPQAAQPASAAPEKLDRSVIVTGLVVVSGLIMVILDTTIVNVALDTLSQELDASLSTAQWVVTGYLLAVGVVIPLSGWAMDHFGTKKVWTTSLILFTVGSALCAVSWSMESLIAFRIIQGLGGGMLLPGGQTIIGRAAGPDRIGRAMALLGVPMLLGPVFGPVVGGLLVEYASWHWIFLVNLPVGVLAVSLAIWKLPDGREPGGGGRFDIRGLVLLSGGLVSLLYGLSEASSRATFTEWGVIGWILAGAVLVTLFVLHSLRRGAESLVDVRLFGNRLFRSGAVAVFLVAIALFGGLLMMPLYYQSVRLEGPLAAGLLLAPQGLGAMMAMPIAGRITDRYGAGRVVPFGVILMLLGTLPFTQVGTDTSYVWLTLALFVRGLGLGSTIMPTIATSYSRLSRAAMSRATPTISAIQQVGGSFGGALLVFVFSRQLTNEFDANGIPSNGGGSQISSIPPALHDRVAPLLAEAYQHVFWTAFILTAVVMIPALFFPRRLHRQPADPQPAASAEASAPGD
jgi:EmrB/QacA subfamily drug resistance transporter